jgi:hypothetical protein
MINILFSCMGQEIVYTVRAYEQIGLLFIYLLHFCLFIHSFILYEGVNISDYMALNDRSTGEYELETMYK